VWQEFAKGLMEAHPQRMFEVLKASGLKLLPEAKFPLKGSLPVRFALLAWPLEEKAVDALCKKLRAPNEVRELAMLACGYREQIKHAKKPDELLDLLKRTDAFRRPERFADLLEVARTAAPKADLARLEKARATAAAVDAGAIAGKVSGSEIGKRVDAARLQAIKSLG
jgi:tRNA nucleotidyltransferase (CCA-adding enzyme)